MSRRRYRRRRGRFGGRGEPVPLLLVPDDDRPFGEALVLAGRALFRYRSELAPVTAGLGLLVLGWWVHAVHPGWWPWLAGAATVLAGGVVLVPRGWLPRWTVLDRHAERAYVGLLVGAGGGWVAAAGALGPAAGPLPALLVAGVVVLGVPWWSHHRRRARVRVERTVEAWPGVAEAAGLAGSRVRSGLVTAWGYSLSLTLAAGQTVRAVIDKIPALESALRTRPGAVRVEPDLHRADRAVLRVVERDPHAAPIPLPPITDQGLSITRPVDLGVWEDGTLVRVSLQRRHVLVGGVMGSGKSGVLNVLLARLTACPDVTLWGIDLKQGMELRPWASCLPTLATTPAQAVAVLQAAVAELNRRANLLADLGLRVWDPSPKSPALVLAIDEYAELGQEAHDLADSIARRGRAVAVTLLGATQRPTQAAMGGGAVRSQMDIRVCLRVRERRDTDLVLGAGMAAAGWRPDLLDAPGKFLLSAPEHGTPRRGRAYHVTDTDVTTLAARHAPLQPAWSAPTTPNTPDNDQQPTHQRRAVTSPTGPAREKAETGTADPVWEWLGRVGDSGITVAELVHHTGLSRATVYRRLNNHAAAGRAEQHDAPHGEARWRRTPITPM